MKKLILIIFLLLPSLCFAKVEAVQVYPKVCKQGEYEQPNGYFSIYVFCDDAAGTNVSVFAKNMHNPVLGPSDNYKLGKRFWQDEPWSYDVVSFAWLNKSQLLLSTSGIYGSGSVYILNLVEKTFEVIYEDRGAVIEIKEVGRGYVLIEMEGPNNTIIKKRIAM
jgi:hypothetical protein